jgi:hypothetical protein
MNSKGPALFVAVVFLLSSLRSVQVSAERLFLASHQCHEYLGPEHSFLDVIYPLSFWAGANGFLTADPYSVFPDPPSQTFKELMKAERPHPVLIRRARRDYWQPEIGKWIRNSEKGRLLYVSQGDRGLSDLAHSELFLGLMRGFLSQTSSRASARHVELYVKARNHLEKALEIFKDQSNEAMEIFIRLQLARLKFFEGHIQVRTGWSFLHTEAFTLRNYEEAEWELVDLRRRTELSKSGSMDFQWLLAMTLETLGEINMWRSWNGVRVGSEYLNFHERNSFYETLAVRYFLQSLRVVVNAPSELWMRDIRAPRSQSLFWTNLAWLRRTKIVSKYGHLQSEIHDQAMAMPHDVSDASRSLDQVSLILSEMSRVLRGL